MTSKRTTPDVVSDPGGVTGSDLGTRIRSSVEWLAGAVINVVGTIGGTANAITGICAEPLIASYVHGQTFLFVPTADNTTTVTINWDSKGAVALVAPDGSALSSGDLQSGEAVECWYDASLTKMRMSRWSTQAIAANALASVSSSLLLTLIGDTTISAATAQVEHTFTAGTYSKITQFISGVSPANNSVSLTCSLRNASAAIVTPAPATAITGNIQAADVVTAEVTYLIDLISSTKTHYFASRGACTAGGTGQVVTQQENFGSSATAPDRVRINFSSGNIDAGRIMTYGLKA